jgi:hypothetical protein
MGGFWPADVSISCDCVGKRTLGESWLLCARLCRLIRVDRLVCVGEVNWLNPVSALLAGLRLYLIFFVFGAAACASTLVLYVARFVTQSKRGGEHSPALAVRALRGALR